MSNASQTGQLHEQQRAPPILTSYYRKFVKDFAKIAVPLHALADKWVNSVSKPLIHFTALPPHLS